MKMNISKSAIALTLIAASSFAHAITNGSFEQRDIADGTVSGIQFVPDAWGNAGGSSLLIDPLNDVSFTQAIDGDQYAKVVIGSAIYQNVAFGAGTYEINFWALGDGYSNLTSNLNGSPTPFVASTALSSTAWKEYTYNYSSAGGYKLWFGTASASGVLIDKVSVTAVPEPESYAMMLAGLGAIGFMARRRKAA